MRLANLFRLVIFLVPLAAKCQGPVRVSVRRNADSTFSLVRANAPYFVKGGGGTYNMAKLAAAGGNSVRTWSTHNASEVLDSAAKYGLTVLLGLDVASERHGFDYDDTAAVRLQLNRLREVVRKYRNHPALLAWGIGNELNLFYSNPKVWHAVQDISRMIHEMDPAHPTATILAGLNKKEVDYINSHCTDLDFIGINIYAPLSSLPEKVKETGWKGAYLVTEWGPTGHWESLSTSWGRPIEETSSEKAAVYHRRYLYGIERITRQCVGSYVFLWGQKQERTPTWYGLFTEMGEQTEVVDVMTFLWSGKWPVNRAPHVYSFQLDGRRANENIVCNGGTSLVLNANVTDPDGDRLVYRWELLPEPTVVGEGGDAEQRPTPVKGAITRNSGGTAILRVPKRAGAYRVFVYTADARGKVATANIPFFVK